MVRHLALHEHASGGIANDDAQAARREAAQFCAFKSELNVVNQSVLRWLLRIEHRWQNQRIRYVPVRKHIWSVIGIVEIRKPVTSPRSSSVSSFHLNYTCRTRTVSPEDTHEHINALLGFLVIPKVGLMFLNYFWFGPGTTEHDLKSERCYFCRQVPTYCDPGSEIDERVR